jgi:uncharacterized protein YbaA (DUF1428 family)
MSKYVDGFIIPIKKNKLKAYKKMATIGRKVWMKYGALDYYECVGANQVNAKVHKDPLMQPENYKGAMPFDMKRFTSGEFKAIVHS